MRFEVETAGPMDVVDVTDRVTEALPRDHRGQCTVFVRHTTAGVVVNEAEENLLDDVETFLSDLVPDEGWRHDQLDDNADAHLRAMLLGESVVLPVANGRLDVGTWQSVLLVECDGPRTRTVDVLV